MPPKKKAKTGPIAFLDAHLFVRPAVEDKIYGCIVGSALGDTIGLYTEFLTKEESAGIYSDREFQLNEPTTELYPDRHRCAYTSWIRQSASSYVQYLSHPCQANAL
jgi:hypothetical protein